LEDLAYALGGYRGVLGDFVVGGWAAMEAQELGGKAVYSSKELVGVNGEADHSAVGVEGAGDALAHPPVGVGGNGVAAGGVKEFETADQAEVALLDEVGEVEAAVLVTLGDGDDQAQICPHHDFHGALSGAADSGGSGVTAVRVVDPGPDALAVAELGLLCEDGVATDLGQIIVDFGLGHSCIVNQDRMGRGK
jgi:hypothetical protein